MAGRVEQQGLYIRSLVAFHISAYNVNSCIAWGHVDSWEELVVWPPCFLSVKHTEALEGVPDRKLSAFIDITEVS
jgi:hypothetical protein